MCSYRIVLLSVSMLSAVVTNFFPLHCHSNVSLISTTTPSPLSILSTAVAPATPVSVRCFVLSLCVTPLHVSPHHRCRHCVNALSAFLLPPLSIRIVLCARPHCHHRPKFSEVRRCHVNGRVSMGFGGWDSSIRARTDGGCRRSGVGVWTLPIFSFWVSASCWSHCLNGLCCIAITGRSSEGKVANVGPFVHLVLLLFSIVFAQFHSIWILYCVRMILYTLRSFNYSSSITQFSFTLRHALCLRCFEAVTTIVSVMVFVCLETRSAFSIIYSVHSTFSLSTRRSVFVSMCKCDPTYNPTFSSISLWITRYYNINIGGIYVS